LTEPNISISQTFISRWLSSTCDVVLYEMLWYVNTKWMLQLQIHMFMLTLWYDKNINVTCMETT
jgi:hypothetical protein